MWLKLKGVSTNNLKDFDLEIPLHQLVVVTGPSGSGKSSLVFDTIATLAENRLKMLANYAQPFTWLEPVKAYLDGPIPPILALRQGVREWYPYKTVGEILGLYTAVEILFSQWGEYSCPNCKRFNEVTSLSQVMKWYEGLPQGERFYVLLPLLEKSRQALSYLQSQGYTRFILNDREIDLSEEDIPQNVEEVYLLLDRMVKEERALHRLLENVRLSFGINRGQVVIKQPNKDKLVFNLSSYCLSCGTPLITFFKKCPACRGHGYKEKSPCPQCLGLKLDDVILRSRLFGVELRQILNRSLREFYEFWQNLGTNLNVSIYRNISTLLEKALFWEADYLSLVRPVFKLSLGERKLLEILLLFYSDFQGVLYILDEPTLGLDKPRRQKLLKLLRELIELGNSSIVIEHDPDFIRSADFVIELGPEGGDRGGYLIRAVTSKEYPMEQLQIPPFTKKKPEEGKFESILLSENFTREIFLGGINLLYAEFASNEDLTVEKISHRLSEMGFSLCLEELYTSEKSNPFLVDYLGIWEAWREVLLQLPETRSKGLTKKHFSFRTTEGVCRGCSGRGLKRVELNGYTHESICEECLGKRLNYEVLNLNYKGYRVSEILDLTLDEALALFSQIPKMRELRLKLRDLRVSYLKLSQSLSELSGGEKLRINLIKKLSTREKYDIFILYYPFQGLSMRDWEDLHFFFRKLNQEEKTILIVDNHPLASDFVDWVI